METAVQSYRISVISVQEHISFFNIILVLQKTANCICMYLKENYHTEDERYRDKPASFGRRSDGSTASSGQACVNKFLAGRSKGVLDLLYMNACYQTT
jgi:hypothetical protein